MPPRPLPVPLAMRIRVVPVTPFQQNCSVLWCERTREAAIVDPGGDLDQVLAAVAEEQVTPVRILLTHGHLDHAGGTAELAQRCSLPIEGPHRSDRSDPAVAAAPAMFGLPGWSPSSPRAGWSRDRAVR